MTMKIIKTTIKVRDLIEDYLDDKSTSQVIGYGKRLDIRIIKVQKSQKLMDEI